MNRTMTGIYEQPEDRHRPVDYSAANLRSLRMFEEVITFKENKRAVNGITFCPEGERMITSGDDDLLIVYNCQNGTKERVVNCAKFGCFDVKHLHPSNNLLFATRKQNCAIRHFSLYDQKFIRFFDGHTLPITRLATSPTDDMFLSASMDRTVRFWDCRQRESLGLMQMPDVPNIAFDPEGLVIAVAVGSQFIKMFDKRCFTNGPFSTFDYSHIKDPEWVDMSISDDGKSMLISTIGNHLRVVDAFNGDLTHTLSGHTNTKGSRLRASFSPCSTYIACGGTDGRITIWSRERGTLIHTITTDHPIPIEMIEFNPAWLLMASACRDTKLWHPRDDLFLSNKSY